MKTLKGSSYFDLIDLIEQQNLVIQKQSESIVKLLNDNAEKENLINTIFT